MKACGAGGRGLGGGRLGTWGTATKLRTRGQAGAGKRQGFHPQPWGSVFQGTGICGSRADTEPGRSPRPLQILSPQPGPAAPGNRTLRIPSSWALCTDASPQRVSGCSDHWGLEDTRVLGSTTAVWPQLSSRRSRRSAWNTPEQTSGTHQQGDSCPALTPQRADTSVLSWFPSALLAPLGPILEPEPRHVTPAAPLRRPRPSLSLDAPPTQLPPLPWGLLPANGPKTRLSRGPGSAPHQGPSGEQAAWAQPTPPGLPPGAPSTGHTCLALSRGPNMSAPGFQ